MNDILCTCPDDQHLADCSWGFGSSDEIDWLDAQFFDHDAW